MKTVTLTKTQIQLLLSATQKLSVSLKEQKKEDIYSQDIINIYLWELHAVNRVLLTAIEHDILD